MPRASSRIVPISGDGRRGEVRWLDNTKLPGEEVYVSTGDPARLIAAIQRLEIRGAPVLGEAGAYGIAMVANNSGSRREMFLNLKRYGDRIAGARPTAVNLSWGAQKVQKVVRDELRKGTDIEGIKKAAIDAARNIQMDNIEATYRIGEIGKEWLSDGFTVMTVCNAGTLAADGIGTATAPLRAAWADGIEFRVLVTYTAPLYQGARLTAWELHRDGIPVEVITDNMAAYFMERRKVDAVWAGADRILGNAGRETGAVFNKIGTLGLAIIAKELRVSMLVAAPTSTIDFKTGATSDVHVEQRHSSEVERLFGGAVVVPRGVAALNPAFDCTPPQYITAIITEMGVMERPFTPEKFRMLAVDHL